MTTPTIQTHMKLVIDLVVREKHLTDAEYNAEIAAIEASARALVAHEREQCALAADTQWVCDPQVSGGDAIRARSA